MPQQDQLDRTRRHGNLNADGLKERDRPLAAGPLVPFTALGPTETKGLQEADARTRAEAGAPPFIYTHR